MVRHNVQDSRAQGLGFGALTPDIHGSNPGLCKTQKIAQLSGLGNLARPKP